MKKLIPTLFLSSALFLSLNAEASNRSVLKISQFDGDFIDSAQEVEIKYQADLGGYAYLNYQNEESSDPFAEFEGETVEVGIGIEEPWESEVFPAEVYLGLGYFASNYEIQDLGSTQMLDANYSGFTAHLGAKMHPFSEDFDVILEIEHNGAGANPINDFNGIIRSKRTRGWIGLGYSFENFSLLFERSSDSILKASISLRF